MKTFAKCSGVALACLFAGCLDSNEDPKALGPKLPLPPFYVRAVAGDREVEVFWEESQQPDSVTVNRFEARTFPDTNHACQAFGVSCVIKGPVNGSSYRVQVRARRGEAPGNWGPWSGFSDTVQLPPPSIAAVPSGVEAHFTPGEREFEVSWAPSDTDGGAPVTYRAVSIEDPQKTCVSTTGSCLVGGLEAGKRYSFKVRAENVAGLSAFSAASMALLLPLQTPLNFTARTSGTSANLRAVAWTGNRAVAVGDGGVILTSSDGVTWTSRVSGTTANLRGVAWNGSTVMAVGDGGTALASADGGITWSLVATGTFSTLSGVAASGGLFVAVGGNSIFTSSGGAWTQSSQDVDSADTRVLASSTGRLMVAGANRRVLSSADGSVWSTFWFASLSAGGRRVDALGADSLFAMSGIQYTLECHSAGSHCHNFVIVPHEAFWITADGMTWRNQVSPGVARALGWSGPQLIAVLQTGEMKRSWDHGLTWSTVSGTYGAVRAFANCGGFIAAVGDQGAVFTAPRNY